MGLIHGGAYFRNFTVYSHTVNIEKISICLNRGREESVGNDDVSIVCARKYEMVRMTNRKSRRDRSGRFCDIYCAVILRYSFELHSDILWSGCFESYGTKDSSDEVIRCV